MKIGIPKEIMPAETRVAATPDSVKMLCKTDAEVWVQTGAGEHSLHADADYEAAGAKIIAGDGAAIWQACDMVLKVRPPCGANTANMPDECAALKADSVLISLLQPYHQQPLLQQLASQQNTALAMELVPRITRAQSMDALSSMATVAGYKAVLIAANLLPRFFPMLTTAAGAIAPARVLILGAGVAGLQAIATARRLGAVVEAFDTRPVVKEQVESLGARFVAAEETVESGEDAGGYATQLSEDQHQRELEVIAGRLLKTDIVITTALIPGKPAPLLITNQMVDSMAPGSVIIDLAGENGGNCEPSELDQTVVRNGVHILAPGNLPVQMPVHASQMYARNVATLVTHIMTAGGVADAIAAKDAIVEPMVAVSAGKIHVA